MTVECLQLPNPFTLLPSVSCQETVEILKEKVFDQVPLVDDSGYILSKSSLNW